MLPFRRLSVCLSACTFLHCAQRAEDSQDTDTNNDVLHMTVPCIFQIVLIYLAYSGKPLPPQILPQSDPHAVDLST